MPTGDQNIAAVLNQQGNTAKITPYLQGVLDRAGAQDKIDAAAKTPVAPGASPTATASSPTTNVAYQPTPTPSTTYGTHAPTPSAPTPTTPTHNTQMPGPYLPSANPPTLSTTPSTPVSGPFTAIVPGYGPPAPNHPVQGTPQQDGTLHLNVNGQTQPNIPVYKGTSFESGAELAKQLGLDYKADPKTGEITIGGTKVMPTGYDKQGNATVGVRAVANALGYQIGYDDKSKMVTVTGSSQKPTPYSNDLSQNQTQPIQDNGYNSPIQSIYNSMPQQQQMTPWTPPDVSGFQNNMMPYQTFNPDMNNFYQQAHNQLDPQFNANNQKLEDKQNLDIKASDESMNRRGIFSSGVAQAAEDDLRAKTTNALAAGFTAQMAQIEKTATTLYNTAYKQYQDGNTFALKNNQDQITNMLNEEKQSFSEWAQTQKLDQSQYNYALKAWNDMASKIMTDAENQTKASQFQQTNALNQTKALLPYEQQTANNAANNATSVANNAANNQTKSDIALLPYQSMTQYQQATTQEKQQMDTAINYFKQQGININESKLMESIRHNQSTEAITSSHNAATEANAAANIQMNAYKLAGYLPNGQPTLDRAKFDQTVQQDKDTVQLARTNAVNSENKTQIDAIGKELSTISSQVNAIIGSYTTDAKQQAANIAMVTSLNGQRDQYLKELKSYTDQGFINPPGQ